MRIDYIRDRLIEEFHEGTFLSFSGGKPENYTYPYYLRSCAKPLQATLLADCGADLTETELALCCGSHAGEECHLETARGIMKKYGITEDMLKCGIHAPLSQTMQDKMLLRSEKPTQIHNNCSGKHLGFLILCKINGWDTENYYELEHPLQQAVIKKIYNICGIESENIHYENTPLPLRDFPRKDGRERINLVPEIFVPLAGEEDLQTKNRSSLDNLTPSPTLPVGEGVRANFAQETLPPLRGKRICERTGVNITVRIANKTNEQELRSESEVCEREANPRQWPEAVEGGQSEAILRSDKGAYQINPSYCCYPITTDGCGVPIVSMPLYNILIGYINLLKYEKIINAIMKNPYIFGGENRLDTEIIQKTEGLVAKVGAGGLCIVLNVKKRDAFVIKINDCSMEARRFAVFEAINRLGWGNIEFDNKIKTIAGKVVGEIVVSF